MNDLLPYDNDKQDAYSRILRFYDKSDIVLTSEEEEIHKRWAYCDGLMRSRRLKTQEIITQLVDQFSVSRYTAQNDIRQAQALFGTVRLLSKRYQLGIIIENLQAKVLQAESDKSLAPLLPKLYHELILAIKSLPDEAPAKDVPVPQVHIGSLTINNNGTPPISIEQARQRWNEIKAKKSKDDYIDHEDVNQ